MIANKITRSTLILILLATIIGCDQLSKCIVRQKIDFNEQINVIDSFVTMTKVENTGAFLSLGNNLPRPIYRIMMIVLPLIVLGYAIHYLFKSCDLSKLVITGICLIIGGGFGNIIDRIIYGSVTDFLYFDFVIFHTGIVNLADISVTAGFFIIMYELVINRRTLNTKGSTK
jgi:signal peptidase II